MTVKEVEEKTGLSRSNIRFYEKEKLIEPSRTPNGYRDYSESDLAEIGRIAFLRSIGIPVDTIRSLKEGTTGLDKVLRKQVKQLDEEIGQKQQAKDICFRMIQESEDSYSLLEVDKYLKPLKPYVAGHREKFRPDVVSFLSLWGSSMVFYALTLLCLLTAVLTFHALPDRIPVQWSGGEVTGEMGRVFIFAYAGGCILCRLVVRPFIWRWLRMSPPAADICTDYLTNFLCLVIFSTQLFSLLYLAGILHHVTWVLAFDAAVFLGMLGAGIRRLSVT